MPTRKLSGPEEPCLHPEHDPPKGQVFSPGVWEHTCPACGKKKVFVVPTRT